MISYRSFTKQFAFHRAVDALTLDVERGTVVALLGPNGSGKTTTLKAAAGLLTPTSGDVLVGEPLRPAVYPTARACLSYLPQRVAFPDSLTGREVVDFYRRLRLVPADRTRAALTFASLNGSSDRTVGTYSGGMVQRLGLAVAMVPDADVLLLDEPTAALDPDGLRAFYDILDTHRAAGRTVLFSSHQMGDVERLADRCVVLVNGRLIASLSQAELRDQLAARGVMRVRIVLPREFELGRLSAIAPEMTFQGDQLIVPGAANGRARVLDAIRAMGLEIRGLTAEDGRLDELYRDLITASHCGEEAQA
jgi:Cu-processing system ATP-binding protein